MRPIAYLLTLLLLAPLAGCLGTGSSPQETAPDTMRPSQQQALLPPEPGLTPRERYRKSLALLEVGEANRAKSELLAYLAAEPGGRYGNRSRDLLMQIDGDPEEMLGKEHFFYEMQKGDSLSTVAKQYMGDPLKFYILARYNDLENPSQMKVGQTIKVPGQKPPDVPVIAAPDPVEAPQSELAATDSEAPDPTQTQEAIVPPDSDEGEDAPTIEVIPPAPEPEPEQVPLQEEELAVEDLQTVMDNAQELAYAGDYQGVADVYEDGLKKYPDDELIRKFAAANYMTLADQVSREKQYERAQAYLERAAELHPENPEIAQSRLANFLAQADQARDEGRSDDEAAFLAEAVEFDPENEVARTRLSEKYIFAADEAREQGRYDEERESLTFALKLDPDNSAIRDRMTQFESYDEADAVFKIGQEYQEAGKIIEADVEYQKALEIFPGHTPTLAAREQLKPQLVSSYYKQGKQAFSREDLEQAIYWFDKALELDPDHTQSEVARNQAMELQEAIGRIKNGQ